MGMGLRLVIRKAGGRSRGAPRPHTACGAGDWMGGDMIAIG